MNEKIRIVVADDHPLLTAGLKMTLEQWDEFEVAGIAADGLEAVELCRKESPHIVIMDMQMPKISGSEAIVRIKEIDPKIRVLAFTTFDDTETVSRAMAAGCDGLLIEVHNDPAHALSDGPQSLNPEAFDKLNRKLLALHAFLREEGESK